MYENFSRFMLLSHSTERLSKILSKYSTIIKQEKLILTEEEIHKKIELSKKLISETKALLEIDSLEMLKRIEGILEDIHKTCTNTHSAEESALPEQKTILLETARKRKFILSVNIPRPQTSFKDKINNYVMKAEGFVGTYRKEAEPVEGILESTTDQETLQFLYKSLLEINTASGVNGIHYIASKEDCRMANEDILEKTVIGVDVKTHRFRSYKGFTCYIQVSTSNAIYIFDMMALRNHSELLTFWEAPIVKVFYKELEKKEWLKKDLNYRVLHSVNLLSFSGLPREIHRLGAAVKYATGENLEKQFHLVDWRHTPMSQEMYIELIEQVKYLLPVAVSLARSTNMQEFVEAYRYAQEPTKQKLTPEALMMANQIEPEESLVKIFLLRDFIAKQEDESPQFLMTDRQLITFIREKPSTPEEVFALFQNISPLFKANLNNFIKLLQPKRSQISFNMTALKNNK